MSPSPWRSLLRFAALCATAWLAAGPAAAQPMHGVAMHGEPALPPDFDHLPYADPDAPKGGRITYAVVGTYDSLNPFIVQGGATSSRGLRDPAFGNNVYESLLTRNGAEAFTLYGLIAETVETPDDRSWVEFTINPLAKFSDGTPITPEDVIFSWQILSDKGRPNMSGSYKKVTAAEQVGERGVRFTFGEPDRELPLIIGLMPILPKHAIDPETFDKSTLTPIPGSGPYVISELHPPDRIVFTRNPDYWGRELPVKRGFDNYDTIVIDYYRETTAMFEAFKRGLYDVNPDGDPAHWQEAYDFPAVADGRVVKESFTPQTPRPMTGFAFNTRRAVFADIRVRKALSMLFDFDWVNRNMYRGAFQRVGSFFQDSELSALGRPAGEAERALLAPFPDAVAPEVMDGTYQPVSFATGGGERAVMRDALALLTEAGYELRGQALVNKATGAPFAFEFMVTTDEAERLALAYANTLKRLGITLNVRRVDSTQYQQRQQTYDFDMIQAAWPASLSPGNEQINRWGSINVDRPGSFNYAGVHSPAADAMIEALLEARSQEDFVAAVRALDRVLISGAYAVPLVYAPETWIARWSRIEHPATGPLTGYDLSAWWAVPGR